ncbi:MAG: HD domain-containing protein [Candidatus Dormibacteria bacterium]
MTTTRTTSRSSSAADAAARFSDVNLIADPLYGYIEITKDRPGQASERELLDTPWLQRLRRIHQLQSAWWVFPTAEHSRFVHLLGAMHLASLFARRVDESLRASFPEAPSSALVEETLRVAGLLHDVGHGPFGHYFDQEFLSRWHIDHEVVGRHLVTHQLADRIASMASSPSGGFADGERIDPMWVAWVMADTDIDGYEPPGWLRALKPILCGPATVDNLDYVPRDAYMCGISLGPVEVQRLIHYTFVSGDTLVLHGHATAALEMFLASRLYMYLNVYHHRAGRRFDLSMREIFAETIDELLPGNPLDHMDAFLGLNDWSVLDAVKRWQACPDGSVRRRLADAWARVLARDLDWQLAFETVARADADTSQLQQRITSLLPPAARSARIEVDVAAARVAPHNPMTEHGFVHIYDPLEGVVQERRITELVSRLPQFTQVVRVFTDDADAVRAVHDAAQEAIEA